MARPLRIEYPGAIYHVTSRGNARHNIFLDDEDKTLFLSKLERATERYGFLFHSYCLMDNHYHLLLETPNANLSLGMQRINGDYTQAFNRRHRRVGHLFQGRFKAVVVEKERHLLELCRYIVLNPVRAKMVEDPKDWPWSSYLSIVGQASRPSFLFIDWILAQFGKKIGTARRQYKKFVAEGIKKTESPLDEVIGQVMLGSDDFIKQHLEDIESKSKVREHPRKQRLINRPSLDSLFKEAKNKDKESIEELAKRAHIDYGYTLKAISDHIRVHYSTVGRMVRKAMEKRPDANT
jgi:putative transposase